MKRIKEFFLLKDDKFFDLLLKLADCAHCCARDFSSFVNDYDKMDEKTRAEKVRELDKHEKGGDILVRTIAEELYRNFITPIDREDIHALASDMDTCIDMLEEAGKKISYYRFEKLTPVMKEQAAIVEAQTKAIRNAVAQLRDPKGIKHDCRLVMDLEDKADGIYEAAMAHLFDPDDILLVNNALLVIKLKDLYDELEDICDLNQKLATIIEGVAIKHV
jgi:hypothetical protein